MGMHPCTQGIQIADVIDPGRASSRAVEMQPRSDLRRVLHRPWWYVGHAQGSEHAIRKWSPAEG